MAEPISSQNEPYEGELEACTYWWCACGRPKTQPFCDGSHKVTDITPVEFTIEEKKTVNI